MSPRRRALQGFVGGALLGTALVLAGLEQPSTVLGAFRLDAFDPRMPIMFGVAVALQTPIRRWMLRRRVAPPSPSTSPGTRIDAELVLGSLVFGVGWGLGGVCPGPGVVGLAHAAPHTLLFAVGLTIGIVVLDRVRQSLARAARPTFDPLDQRP